MLVVPTAARHTLRGHVLNQTVPEDLVLKLFANDHTPGAGDLIGEYQEVSGFGYAAVALVAGTWTNSPTGASYPQMAFTFTGAAGPVYGYYVVGASSGALKWAERFDTAPDVIQGAGDQIKVTLKFN